MAITEDKNAEQLGDYMEYLIQCAKEKRFSEIPDEWYILVLNEMRIKA